MGYTSQSAVLKREIEAKLSSRIPSALSPQALQAPRLMATGAAPVDALIGGGLPIGGISELTGGLSSGRTSLALSLMAEASAESACAWVDVNDTFDPQSGAAAGVCLRNLLWIRIASLVRPDAMAMKPISPVSIKALDNERLAGQRCGGHHPRTESRGLAPALETMLSKKVDARSEKMEETPSCPNRRLTLAAASEEQIQYEHFNARRADASDPLRQADQRAATEARERTQSLIAVAAPIRNQAKPWNRLEQAIKATDQILQSGGFRVVVLDLASVSPEQALRIPTATWFRFRRAAQESDAILLLLTQAACARSSALCVLDCSAAAAKDSISVLSGLSQTTEVARQRLSSPFAKKAPGRVVTWETTPVWMRAVGR